ncbi:MAG: tRNA (guanosine(37)-N1)-methyltransferase TrmD [Flavobacteriaceae bacterium]|nr:tRNA (guanosine(37)-N1)-methyltransferase TrmD [Flavobacteriaceae bacterium]|tara:strand:- start:14849 stop:15571 length:723 start_codon:yes stop_codon:yes gene_type:complete
MSSITWKISIITTTPEIFPGPLQYSNIGKSLADGKWSLEIIPLEKRKNNKKVKIDGSPAGGGPGMIMKADIVLPIINNMRESGDTRPLIVPAARGIKYDQKITKDLIRKDGLIFLCGRFEGIDQRIIESTGALELSIGDYILTNGDIAAINIIDSCVRLLDGVLSTQASTENESYEDGLLEYPQYTLPRDYGGLKIPDVLLSGDHGAISKWRYNQSLLTTEKNRPDLYRKYKKKTRDSDS